MRACCSIDPLPAGLEIDNPDLFDGGSIDALSWIKGDIQPAHTEYRDDRFVAAFDRDGKDKATFSARLYRPRGDARPLCAAGGDDRRHVPAAALRPHRLRRARRGAGEMTRRRSDRRMSLVAVAGRRRWRSRARARVAYLAVARSARSARRGAARPSCSTATARCCAPSPWPTGAGACRRESTRSIRASSPCCSPTRTGASIAITASMLEALARAAAQWICARPYRLRRLDADDAGRAPARAARGKIARRETAPDRARDRDRTRIIARTRFSISISRWRPMAAISKASAPRASPISARSRSGSRSREAALLVALPQSPETRRPDRFPEVARAARDRVLDRAFARHVITAAERDAAKQKPCRKRAGPSRRSPPMRPKKRCARSRTNAFIV